MAIRSNSGSRPDGCWGPEAVPSRRYQLQIGVNGRKIETVGAIGLQRPSSAPALAKFARGFAVTACVKQLAGSIPKVIHKDNPSGDCLLII